MFQILLNPEKEMFIIIIIIIDSENFVNYNFLFSLIGFGVSELSPM